MSKLKKITGARLFLPIVCLIAVLLINVIKTPDFFNVSIQNGVLYGYIIDVINRASELVILAVGMTLVTAASGGQDISVGAVMAGSCRCMLPDPFRRRGFCYRIPEFPHYRSDRGSSGCCALRRV